MREKDIERYLHTRVTQMGGTTRKWVSTAHCGVPDRICFLPGGIIFFVELKTPRGKVSVRQEREIKTLQDLGARCFVAVGMAGVDEVLRKL